MNLQQILILAKLQSKYLKKKKKKNFITNNLKF